MNREIITIILVTVECMLCACLAGENGVFFQY